MYDTGLDYTDLNGETFSTKDHGGAINCATAWEGAWWYNSCHRGQLNGKYHDVAGVGRGEGICWYHWGGSYRYLKSAEMKMRHQ